MTPSEVKPQPKAPDLLFINKASSFGWIGKCWSQEETSGQSLVPSSVESELRCGFSWVV